MEAFNISKELSGIVFNNDKLDILSELLIFVDA